MDHQKHVHSTHSCVTASFVHSLCTDHSIDHRTHYRLQKLEKNSPQNTYDAEISDIIT